MDGLLSGKTAFITGAAGGIGLAVALAFQSHGANVVIADIAEREMDEAMLQLDPHTSASVKLDVTSETATQRALEVCLERFGGADIVVPNAGILLLQQALDLPVAAFRRVLEVNLIGAFITAKTFSRYLVSRAAGGRIIFTSSLSGIRGGADNAAYAASKFGMIGLAQSLAAELAPNNIRVNCVCPGQIDTAMMRQLFADRSASRHTSPEAERAAIEGRIPMQRLADPQDVAGAYVYLASDLSRYVTGQSIVVDGGWQVG